YLMENAWKNRVEKIVHISSAGLLENSDSLASEKDFPLHPKFGGAYKKSKWLAEKLVLQWAKRGLPVAIASPSCPIGAEDERPTPTGQIILDFLKRRFPVVSH